MRVIRHAHLRTRPMHMITHPLPHRRTGSMLCPQCLLSIAMLQATCRRHVGSSFRHGFRCQGFASKKEEPDEVRNQKLCPPWQNVAGARGIAIPNNLTPMGGWVGGGGELSVNFFQKAIFNSRNEPFEKEKEKKKKKRKKETHPRTEWDFF